MPVNSMDIQDARVLLNAIHNQVTGQSALTPTSTAEFISQATTTLSYGYNNTMTAISQVLGRTIVAVRPYDAKFKGLVLDYGRWGGIVRKLSFIDDPVPADQAYQGLVDGTSIDPWKIHKPKVVETHFYGSDSYQDEYTITEIQLKNAFRSEEEFGAFMSGITLHFTNKWEQYQEDLSRAMLANLIAAKNVADPTSVFHLLTLYNGETGQSLTKQDAAIDPTFWKWVRAKVNTIGRRMTARSGLYQMALNAGHINRHTPLADQKIYLAADVLDKLNTVVNADTYHDEPLKYADVEAVDFWQSIQSPLDISVTPSYIDATGAVVANPTAQVMSDVFGVIFDRDATGYTIIDYSVMNSPYNQTGKYFNVNLTANIRYMNDLTEKAAVLVLD